MDPDPIAKRFEENDLPLPTNEGNVVEEGNDDDNNEEDVNEENMTSAINNLPDGACEIIGIDLGTKNTVVAVMKNGKIEVIPTPEDGKCLFPSVVAFCRNGQTLVGVPAVRKLNTQETCFFDIKRIIGRQFDDAVVQRFAQSVETQFTVRKLLGGPVLEFEHRGQAVTKSPQDISAQVLGKIRETAENFLRDRSNNRPLRIYRAVVTVPAHFALAQKNATKEAARQAGFTDVFLITEPGAAAYAYGFDNQRFDGYKILVFDFGGGTFDVSILNVQDNTFEQRAIAGDPELGGRDLDLILRDYCAQEIKERWGRDCLVSKMIAQTLLEKCEEMKITLSSAEEASFYMGGNFGVDEDFEMTRRQLEQLFMDKIQLSMQITEKAIRDINLTVEKIDEVLLVGGSSKIPLVSELLVNQLGFPVHKLNHSVNADEAVARGAAVFAAQLSDRCPVQLKMALLEAIPLSLGIAMEGDCFDIIIPRNTKIPCEITKSFVTVVNDQFSTFFEVFEGERKIASKNNSIGNLFFDGLTPGAAGSVTVRLTLSIDRNGILNVVARHNGRQKHMAMDYKNAANVVDEVNVSEMLESARLNDHSDKAEVQRQDARFALQTAIESTLYTNSDNPQISTVCSNFKQWLLNNCRTANVDEFRNKLGEFSAQTSN